MRILCGCFILWFSTGFTAFETESSRLAIDPDLDPNDNLDEDQFMAVFGEEIDDPVEKERRSDALRKNEDIVKRINRKFINGEVGFYERINPNSDIPDDEFLRQRTGAIFRPGYSRGVLIANESEIDEESERYFDRFHFSRQSTPSSYDSLELGHVTSIKDQMRCGSCTAFSSTVVMETVFAKITGKLADYAEQELLDYGYDHYHAKGCDGAQIYAYFKWLAKNKRKPMHEKDFPYFHNLHFYCPAQKPYNIGAKIKDAHHTFTGNEEMLKKLVAKHGAVVVTIAVWGDFEGYAGGVLDVCPRTDLTKKENGPHAVAVVGYGSEMVNGRMTDFWLIKNSWGTRWGIKGFIKIKRGHGLCGIGKHISVLVAEKNPDPISPPLPDYEVCMDIYKNCPTLAKTNCKGYGSQCKKSCGLCKGMTPKKSLKCPDTWDTCPKIAKEGNCIREEDRLNCCISCKTNLDETEEEKEKRLCRDDYDIGRENKFCPVQGARNCKEHANRCKKSCGLCKGMTPHISYTCPEPHWCSTKKEKCYQWGKQCPATCGLCEGMTPAPSNTCYDKHSKRTCQEECKKGHNGWNERNCKKTCDLC